MRDLIVSVPDHCLSFYSDLHLLSGASPGPTYVKKVPTPVFVTSCLEKCLFRLFCQGPSRPGRICTEPSRAGMCC